MSVSRLSRFVQGLWDDAISYLTRFLQPVSHPQSDEAQVLIHFLWHHKAFASMVAGESNRYLKYVNHDSLRMRYIVLSLLHSEGVRASLDWERVPHKASRVVQDLLTRLQS